MEECLVLILIVLNLIFCTIGTIPTYIIIHTFIHDGSKYVLGMLGFMGLDLPAYIFDLSTDNWSSINFAGPYIGKLMVPSEYFCS